MYFIIRYLIITINFLLFRWNNISLLTFYYIYSKFYYANVSFIIIRIFRHPDIVFKFIIGMFHYFLIFERLYLIFSIVKNNIGLKNVEFILHFIVSLQYFYFAIIWNNCHKENISSSMKITLFHRICLP